MNQICHSDEEILNNFILNTARKVSRNYPSRYQDVDDYVQDGLIALYMAKAQWSKNHIGSFLPYAKVCVGRAIRKSAIKSIGQLSCSYKIKLLIIKIQQQMNSGLSRQESMDKLNINSKHQFFMNVLMN